MLLFPPARFPRSLTTGAASAALVLALVGCDATAGFTDPTHSGAAQLPSTAAEPAPTSKADATRSHLTDYEYLLLQAEDLSDSEDTFAERSTDNTPNGVPGASTLFVNADDTRAISVTVAAYPGAPTAEATLREAVATSDTVLTGGEPQPLGVGTGGTSIKGTSPDGAKAVTLVLFTHDNVLARLQFDSAPDDPATDQFVSEIAKMQQVALRVGIPESTE